MTATRLGPTHLAAVRRLLLRDVESNLFLLGLLHGWSLGRQSHETWYGVPAGATADGEMRPSDELSAIVFLAGRGSGRELAVPFGALDACRELGRHVAAEHSVAMVIGPREESDALWEGLGDPVWRIRYDQRLYVCTAVRSGPFLEVRTGQPQEIAMLSDWAGQMMDEDLGEDPRAVDPEAHFIQVSSRIHEGRTLVGVELGRPVFKLDIGTRFNLGAQVGGTWVPKEHRGRGVATRGMRAATRMLLDQVPLVTLHVNEANTPAVRAYESVGYTRARAFRLVARQDS